MKHISGLNTFGSRMNRQMNRWIALGTLGVMATSMAMPFANQAVASPEGRKNTTIAAGAATAYALLKGKNKLALLGGLGTAYAYKRYRDAKKSNRRQTIGQVFGNTPVYDSKRHRYGKNSQFYPNRTYYNARGRAIG